MNVPGVGLLKLMAYTTEWPRSYVQCIVCMTLCIYASSCNLFMYIYLRCSVPDVPDFSVILYLPWHSLIDGLSVDLVRNSQYIHCTNHCNFGKCACRCEHNHLHATHPNNSYMSESDCKTFLDKKSQL